MGGPMDLSCLPPKVATIIYALTLLTFLIAAVVGQREYNKNHKERK